VPLYYYFVLQSPHSGDWLLGLSISSCGLRLDDEAVRVAVGLNGLNIYEPHTCRCGALVDDQGFHSFVCKSAAGRTARHHVQNGVIYRASAGMPATKEPVGHSPSRKKAWRSHPRALMCRRTLEMGRYGSQHFGEFICIRGGAVYRLGL